MPVDLKKRPSKKAVILTGIVALLTIAGINGSAQNNSEQSANTSSSTDQTQQVQATKAVKAPVVEVKTVTETETVSFAKKTENDPSLESGKTVVGIVGANGERTISYRVTYTDGKETAREKSGEQITRQPIDEVTKVGTKVALSCPNGTYVNSIGNTVCSPYAGSSVPAGASAKCSDGTYSFSQSRRGTCSHHGGVAIWY